ncbi:MAG: SGNH/GDSL hydrolase family protein [Bacteroidota bacterium]
MHPDKQVITLKYLALGDSYTIGENVCKNCGYPIQLKNSLQKLYPTYPISVKTIAKTGWTTGDLISAINNEDPANDYDFVTLLIGVNNQYQNKPFPIYEKEFPVLLKKAIAFAKGNKKNVIVISIPDYAFTSFGQRKPNPKNISLEIDHYNAFAENYCLQNGVEFLNVTDISRQGLNNPGLVTKDGLHPSEEAYSRFTERLLPKIKSILNK